VAKLSSFKPIAVRGVRNPEDELQVCDDMTEYTEAHIRVTKFAKLKMGLKAKRVDSEEKTESSGKLSTSDLPPPMSRQSQSGAGSVQFFLH